ncbi:MAG: hypothetical protein AAFV72_11485 [Cyanobacteria bacterium J06635_1]
MSPQKPLREPLIELGLLLGLMILVLPRLLLPPQPSRLRPMVAEFGLSALRLSVIYNILSQRYAVVTLAHYDQLTPGMPLSVAESIVGFGSEVRSQALPGGAIAPALTGQFAITYEWVNPDGSRLIATFQDMKLTGKAQAGLE